MSIDGNLMAFLLMINCRFGLEESGTYVEVITSIKPCKDFYKKFLTMYVTSVVMLLIHGKSQKKKEKSGI